MRSIVCGVPVDLGMDLASAERIIGTAIDAGSPLLVSFVNPQAVSLSSDPQYLPAVSAVDLLLCDGIGMAIAATLLTGVRTRRVSFDSSSLAPFVFHKCSQASAPLILVGGHPGVSARAAETFEKLFPGLRIVGTFSGYGDDPVIARERIEENPWSVVIVGMGAGRQEAFLMGLRDGPWHGVGISCGGFMDQTLRGFPYYPAIVDRLNLRFLYRLADEPGRLWRRYLVEYRPFIGRLGKELVRNGRRPQVPR